MLEDTSLQKFNLLRRQAELFIKTGDFINPPTNFNNPIKLIQDLQTTQMELELQNSELKRSQKELIKSRTQYKQLYDFAPVGYVTVNEKGTILNANLRFADMVPTQKDGVLNQLFTRYVYTEDQHIFHTHLHRLSFLKKRQVCELRMKKNRDEPFDVQLESTVISNERQEGNQFQIVIIDIRERKQAEMEHQRLEEQLRFAHKMKSINKIAGGIAHDFNNIFHIILGNVELLSGTISKWESEYKKLETIKETALRGASVVKGLLNFSCRTDQKFEPINVIGVIKEQLKLLRASFPSTIDIRESFPDTEMMIFADPVQIGQILMNLCTNASQVMAENGGVIEIGVEKKSVTDLTELDDPDLSTGEHIKIFVRDTGPGIDPEVVDHIFDPYFTTKGLGQASGMGLAIVYGIVKNHKGQITVETSPGRGAVFNLFFPAVKKESVGQAQVRITDSPFGSETVLFVDDEESITEIAKELLEKLGYHVEAHLDPLDALAVFKAGPDRFDLVVTDMTMPKMTGLKLFENIQKIRADLPAIICTGHSALIDKEKADKSGISGYMMKPVSILTLAHKIRKMLDFTKNS